MRPPGAWEWEEAHRMLRTVKETYGVWGQVSKAGQCVVDRVL